MEDYLYQVRKKKENAVGYIVKMMIYIVYVVNVDVAPVSTNIDYLYLTGQKIKICKNFHIN